MLDASCEAEVGELPVQASAKFEMVINSKTAKLLGIKVPDDLLASAHNNGEFAYCSP